MDKSDEQYYTIGKLSKLCNIPIRTLHYYDDIGLLQPQKVDPYTNYRYYSHHQLTDISAIKHFKMAGFSLKEIKQLLERNNIDYNQEMIRSKCLEIENNIKNLMI
jgi:DNA-binding transcriptional MerR regulator